MPTRRDRLRTRGGEPGGPDQAAGRARKRSRQAATAAGSVAQGALTVDQLRELLDLQATRDAGWMRLGDLAVAEGLITPEQLRARLFPSGRVADGLAAGTAVREPLAA